MREIKQNTQLAINPEQVHRTELTEILAGRAQGSIPAASLEMLVPARAREIAKNPTNIEVRQLRNEPGEISLIVLEKDFPEALTSPAAYKEWQEAIKKAKLEQKDSQIRILPYAPAGVDRMHAKFLTFIEQGLLSLNDRVLMTCKLRLDPDNLKALLVVDFDGEVDKGIGKDFYMNTLPAFCRAAGLRFIVGQNHGGNFSFFTDVLGRYSLYEIKPELRKEFFPIDNAFYTIQFLYPEDIKKYVVGGAAS